ncbi:MAG: hypothetical protein LAQ69_27245 [Acidobacteriia bacterium]|nr:hypothetical protein [Terriglobia bacterium]
MSRSILKFLAVLLGVLIVVVFFAGLDGLPRSLRAQIGQERSAFASSQKQLHAAQDEVLANLRSESDLFRAIPASQEWPGQLSQALGDLQLASHDIEQLAALEKQNRRQDRQQVETLLAQERALRGKAVDQAAGIQKEAAHWVDLKRHLPEELQRMEQDYNTIHGFDLAPITATVQKAETDWPEKARNLEKRLGDLRDVVTQGETAWQSSAETRRLAAAGDLAHLDFAALVAADNALKTAAAGLPAETQKLEKHSAQLYVAWDKILVDMEPRGNNQYGQKIRTVQTHFADASSKTGEVTSDEKWVNVSQAVYEAQKNDLGMAIEHKPEGKYEAEAEHVAQPAGFAYVAPPSQGSNQYGYWDHRNGSDFWVFYGQYALMRDLLWNHQYQPVDRYDWEGYRTYQSRGQTYYGRDATSSQSAPRYGTQGSATQNRYSGSTFAKGGGFKDSRYATKSGSYSDSKYATPGGDRTPKKFGSGSSRPEQPHASPPPSRPRPTYRPPSAPRRFGKR